MRKSFVVVWTVLLLLFRPSFVGEVHNVEVFAAFAAATLVLLTFGESRLNFSVPRAQATMGLAIIAVITYYLVQGFALSDAKSTVLNSAVLICGVTFCILLAMRSPRNRLTALKTIVYVHAALAVSAIVTYCLYAASGWRIDALTAIADVYPARPTSADTYGSFNRHVIYFPFTAVWSSISGLSHYLPRFIALYREPGMAQIFMTSAYFLSYCIPVRAPRLVRLVLLIGSLLTFSTAGLLSLVGGHIVLYITTRENRRTFLPWLGIALALGLLVFLPDSGLSGKLQSSSGTERSSSYVRSVAALSAAPVLGQGYYSGFARDDQGYFVGEQFLGLIGVSYQLGILGIGLYCLLWLLSVVTVQKPSSYCVLVPCALTLILSQPSYNDVFVWFLLLTPIGGARKNAGEGCPCGSQLSLQH